MSVGVALAGVVGVAVWGALRGAGEAALPSFPGAGRFSYTTPRFGSVAARRYTEVEIPGDWEGAVARLDGDLTGQGFRAVRRDGRLVVWTRGEEVGATATVGWSKARGRFVRRFSFSRPANFVEEAGRWVEDRWTGR